MDFFPSMLHWEGSKGRSGASGYMTQRRSEEIKVLPSRPPLNVTIQPLGLWACGRSKGRFRGSSSSNGGQIRRRSNISGAFCRKVIKKHKTKRSGRQDFVALTSSKTLFSSPFCWFMTVTLTAPPAGRVPCLRSSLFVCDFFYSVLRSIQKTCKLKQKKILIKQQTFFFFFLPG